MYILFTMSPQHNRHSDTTHTISLLRIPGNASMVFNSQLGKYTFTLIGYVFLYYIGEILRKGTHNLSYIYGNACINIV